jgi:hypothetical protein
MSWILYGKKDMTIIGSFFGGREVAKDDWILRRKEERGRGAVNGPTRFGFPSRERESLGECIRRS